MIRYYQKKPKDKVTSELTEYQVGSWVYVQNATQAEIEELVEKFKLDMGHLEDAHDSDEMPRLEREDDQTYLFTRFAHTDEDLVLTTSPLLLIFHPNCLISISSEPLPGFERLISGKKGIDTAHQGRLALHILDEIDDKYEKYLSDINKQIKTIRARLRVEEIRNQDFVRFVTIEDELNEFMTALTPMSPILKRLMLGKHIKLSSSDKELAEDLFLNNEQSLSACRSSIKSVTNIREAYSTIMSNDLNRIIRILTVLTVLISIPTLIASIYGMNVDLPFERSADTFSGLMILSIILSISLLLYFKRKKWL